MSKIVKYDRITLSAQRGCVHGRALRRWLEDNGIEFRNLEYDDTTETLAALGTWFRDDAGTDKKFDCPSVVTWDGVKWESPEDPDERFAVQGYAERPDAFPADFVEKAIKE